MRTSQLVGILVNRNKIVKIGPMNIMVLLQDVSCVSLSEIAHKLSITDTEKIER